MVNDFEDPHGTHPIDSSCSYNDGTRFNMHKDNNNRERGAIYAYPRCSVMDKKHDTSRFLNGTQPEYLSCLSVNYLGVRVSMPRNVV